MSILVDHEIRQAITDGQLVIEPFLDTLIQPNSYDVRLSDAFSWHQTGTQVIDPYDPKTIDENHQTVETESIVIPGLDKFVHPLCHAT